MIVQLNDRWRLVSDDRQWTIQRYIEPRSGSKTKPYWANQAYYGTFEAALSGCVRRQIALDPSYNGPEALEALHSFLKTLRQEIDKAVQEAR
jgi:hypothetical protein